MEIEVNGYTVKITANCPWFEQDEATRSFANWLSLALSELGDYYAKDDSEAVRNCAKYMKADSRGIYDILNAAGFYK